MSDQCFVFTAAWYHFFYRLVGYPCVVVLVTCVIITLLELCGVKYCLPSVVSKYTGLSTSLSSVYGDLLEPIHSSSAQDEVDLADRQVNGWMIAGAIAAIVYGVAIMALAISHQNYTGWVESFLSFLMCLTKLVVSFCARKVDRCLSTHARQIVGNWVFVLAASKFSMAICGLLQSLGYFLAALSVDVPSRPNPSDPEFCNVLFFFTLICCMAIVFQTSAAFALFRIQQLSLSAMVDTSGTWGILIFWVLFVCFTFGVGLAWWGAGALFVLGSWANAGLMSSLYTLAALCQFGAGATMFAANCAVRSYFTMAMYCKRDVAMSNVLGSREKLNILCPDCGTTTLVSAGFTVVSCLSCARTIANPDAKRVLCTCGASNLASPGAAQVRCGKCQTQLALPGAPADGEVVDGVVVL